MSLNQNLFKLMNKRSITWYSSGSVNVYNIPCLGCGSRVGNTCLCDLTCDPCRTLPEEWRNSDEHLTNCPQEP